VFEDVRANLQVYGCVGVDGCGRSEITLERRRRGNGWGTGKWSLARQETLKPYHMNI